MSSQGRGSESYTVDASRSRPANRLRRACVAASYSIRGIWYFLRNREFWPLFTGRLLPLSLISFLVYLILFTFAFLPQYAFLVIFHGWGAWVNAVVLTLGEGLVIIQGLFEGFFVDECRVDVFDVSHHRFAPHKVNKCKSFGSTKCFARPLSSNTDSTTSLRLIEFFLMMRRRPSGGWGSLRPLQSTLHGVSFRSLS